MWGRHVAKLSGGHRGPRSRCYSSLTDAMSVSEPEFLEAFLKVCPRNKWKDHGSIGIAISGGVDSMALATLYSEALKGPTGSNLPKCHAIIIDHKYRPESTEEAKWVSDQLESKFDIYSTIVPLTWPKTTDGTDISVRNFESMARRLRNQAIGRLCRDKNLKSFMLAHHLDDQAEGVLLRLMLLRFRSGLVGMKPVESITECHGIHGVHDSSKNLEHFDMNLPFPLEGGGIQVLRPLLSFDKSRLIATCEEHGTAWAEDKTNQDATLTNRNAVRHIFRNHKLPAALSRDSLVSLAMHMKQRFDAHNELVNDVFNNCLIKLDIQTGSLVVRLPPVTSLLDRPILTESDILLARTNAIVLVSRLASLVAPRTSKQHGTPLGQLNTSIDTFYPDLRTGDSTHAMLRERERSDSTWAGVWFRRWDKPTPFHIADAPIEEQGTEWMMCRQPIDNNPSALFDHQIIVPSLRADPSAGEKWHFFDARYWIRVKNHGAAPLKIRNFEPGDVETLAEDLQRMPIADHPRMRSDDLIKRVLMFIEDSRSRRGFPGIFWTDEEGRDILIALPTFNITVNLRDTASEALRYDIHYKKIDIGNRSLDEIVVPGVTKARIADEAQKLMYSKTEHSLPAASYVEESSHLYTMNEEDLEGISYMGDNTDETSTEGTDEAKPSYNTLYSETYPKGPGHKGPTNSALIGLGVYRPPINVNEDSHAVKRAEQVARINNERTPEEADMQSLLEADRVWREGRRSSNEAANMQENTEAYQQPRSGDRNQRPKQQTARANTPVEKGEIGIKKFVPVGDGRLHLVYTTSQVAEKTTEWRKWDHDAGRWVIATKDD